MNYYVGMKFYHTSDRGLHHYYEVKVVEQFAIYVSLVREDGYDVGPMMYSYNTFTVANGWAVRVDMDKELEQL
jgi:hypothetical protein